MNSSIFQQALDADYYKRPKKKRKSKGITKDHLWSVYAKYNWNIDEDFCYEPVAAELNMSVADLLFITLYFLNLNWYKANLRPVTVDKIKKRYAKRKMNWGIDWKIEGGKIVSTR